MMHSSEVTTLTTESIDSFRRWSIARGRSKNTAKAYSTDLKMMLAWNRTPVILMSQFEEVAMEWLNQTREEASPKTTGRRLTSLRAFAKWTGNPTLLLDYKAPTPARGQPHPLPEGLEGVQRMIDVTRNAEQRALVALCGFAGLRVGEALAMKTSWLDPHTMFLTIRGKGDKSRRVPISPRVWDLISEAFTLAMVGDGKLIHYQDRSARKCITALGVKASLSRKVASHDLRATFATEVYNSCGNQRIVQELLGHASGSTTEVYIGVRQTAMIEAVNF